MITYIYFKNPIIVRKEIFQIAQYRKKFIIYGLSIAEVCLEHLQLKDYDEITKLALSVLWIAHSTLNIM